MSRLGDRGYRLVMIGRDDATERDVTHRASALKYESRLPGGHATCQFILSGPAREARALARHLDEVKVYFGDIEVWNGRVEESDPKADGSLAVTALGWSADLKAQQFTRLMVEGGYGRWVNVTDAGINYPSIAWNSSYNFASPILVGVQGAAVAFTLPAGSSLPATAPTTFQSTAAVYIPPETIQVLGGTATLSWSVEGDFQIALFYDSQWPVTTWTSSTVIYTSSSGSSGSQILSIPSCGAMIMLVGYLGTGVLTASRDNYVWLTNVGIVGARHPDTGAAFGYRDVFGDQAIRNLLASFGGGTVQSSDERMRAGSTPHRDLCFDKPSTIEDALKRVCDVEGWTWGVFDRKLMSLGPIEHITTAPSRDTPNLRAGTPPWWMTLRGEDHTTDLTHTLQGVVNRVLVPYVRDTGTEGLLTVEDFDNPLNPLNKPGYPPRQIRTATVSLQGSTPNYSVAVAAANAYLAQYGRPAAAGQITLADRSVLDFVWGYDPATPLMIDGAYGLDVGQLGSDVPQAPPSSRPASAVLPGWWVHIPDGTDAMYDSQSTASSIATRTPPGGLLVIRSVKVDADRGEVTLDIDSGRDAFDRFQARLAAG